MGESLQLSTHQRLDVIEASGDELRVESTWEPHSPDAPVHWHPQQDEHFEVLAGELTVSYAGGEVQVYRAGETIDLPARTAHGMRNDGDEP